MNRHTSILQGISEADVIDFPFPHIVVENLLDLDLCDQLIGEFPSIDLFAGNRRLEPNTKIHLSATDALNSDLVSQTWKRFIQEQLTQDAWANVVRIFGNSLRASYPDYETSYGRLSDASAGIRNVDDFSTAQILLDAQISIHTPVYDRPCVDRGPHLKTRQKPIEAYLLLKPDDDDSQGADFEFYSIRPGVKPEFGPTQVVDPMAVRLEKSVPYKKNLFIMFLNTQRSVQGFSMRTTSGFPLMYFNFNVTAPAALYEIDTNPALFKDYASTICPNKVREPMLKAGSAEAQNRWRIFNRIKRKYTRDA